MPDTNPLLDIIARLEGTPADGLESETLEFKSWDPTASVPERKRRVRGIRESVVAMANARGGTIVLGVADRKRTRQDAIQGVGNLDSDGLRRDIYDGTEPHILVDLGELALPEGRLLVLRVPRGLPPHTTADGVAKIRIGKESKPLTGSGLRTLISTRAGHDPSAQVLPDARWTDIDPDQIRRLRGVIAAGRGDRGLARLPDEPLIEALGLGAGGDLTLAAILLLGTRAALARFAPCHELIFLRRLDATRYDARRDFRTPLLQTLEAASETIRSHIGLTTVPVSGLRDLELPDVSAWVAREAILNAVTHRDYFPSASVTVSLYSDRLEVTSPGGFPGTVTADNVIRHHPVRRNELLTAVFRDIGLAERVGQGVDRIYTESLRAGKRRPFYEGASDFVRLTLPTRTDRGFVQFVDSERQQTPGFDLDDLLIFDALRDDDEMDRWSAAKALQTDEERAARHLATLGQRGYLAIRGRGRGTKYRLSDRIATLLRETRVESPRNGVRTRQRILSALARGERLTNARVRRLTNQSRHQAMALMRALCREGLATMEGTRGGARYLAGPRLPLEPPDSAWPRAPVRVDE